MAAGKALIAHVAGCLDPVNGKTVLQIRALTAGCSSRAIRYAVGWLLEDGRATRKGQLIFAGADLVVDVRNEAGTDPVKTAVPLRECFGDDFDGYASARADLLSHGSTWTGGGAAPAVFLKIHEAV